MIYDVIILGGGPAGLTSAIYASRARLKTLVIESFTVPGQAVITADIENYPGFEEELNGFDLIDRFKKQAKKFEAEFKVGDVVAIEEKKAKNPIYKVKLKTDESFEALSVIIATGAHPRKLNVPGEDRFRGRGVSYCATCDGTFFKEKEIAVVGGGDTAIEEALFLTKFASKVTVIHRRSRLRATKILQERTSANKKINFIWDSIITELKGGEKLKSLKLKNVKTGKESEFESEGAFIFVGYLPNTVFLKKIVKLDKNGYIVADDDMKTSKKGIFTAGDARKKSLRQIVTACGDGATAAYSARMYVEELKGIAYK